MVVATRFDASVPQPRLRFFQIICNTARHNLPFIPITLKYTNERFSVNSNSLRRAILLCIFCVFNNFVLQIVTNVLRCVL